MSIVLEPPTLTGDPGFVRERGGAASALPITWIDKGLLFIVAFLLAYNTPATWSNVVVFDTEVLTSDNTGDGQVLPFLALTLLYLFLSLRCDVIPIIRAALREPFLLAFLFWALATTLWSGVPDRTLTNSLNLGVIAVIGYWVALRFTVAQFLGVMAFVFGAGTGLHFVWIFVMGTSGKSVQGWDGVLGNRNTLGASCSLAVLLFLTTARVHRRFRVLAYAGAIANVVLILGTESKTSLVMSIGLPTSMIVFTVFRARRTLYAAVVISMTVFAGVFAAIALDQFPKLADSLDRDVTLSGRAEIWAGAIDLIKDNPWRGYGWDATFFDWSTPGRVVWLDFGTPIYHSHNGLLEVTLNGGLVAGFLAAMVLIRLIIRGTRLVRYYRTAIGMLPLTFATYVFVSSITEPGVYFRGLPLLVFVVIVTIAGRGRKDALTVAETDGVLLPGVFAGLRRSR